MRPDTWEDLSLTKLRNNLSESLRNVLKAKRYFNDRLGSIYSCANCSAELSVFTVERSFKSEETKEEEEEERRVERGLVKLRYK